MNTNRICGTIGIALGVLCLIGALNIPEPVMGDALGPKFFPLLVSGGMIIIGIVTWLTDVRNAGKGHYERTQVITPKWKEVYLMIGVTIVIGLVYSMLFVDLGYIISTFIFVGAILSLVNPRRHVMNLIIALVFSVGAYYVFAKLLGLSLPRGVLGFF
ncbi:MAG: tripartite tricarboxylate transporter TctB family protein [Synergistales bacterium]|nr:tripartite tricarboxylate transporter TctB family protein [Synergistales bacterium]